MSQLVDYARYELELIGEEPEIIEWYVGVIEAFESFDHSGATAQITTRVLSNLFMFHPLSPLSDRPEEWFEVTDGLWQSARNPEAFSTTEGKTYYLLSEGGNSLNPGPTHESERHIPNAE